MMPDFHLLTGLYVLIGVVVLKIVDHIVSYFWRKFTDTEKYITKKDLRLHMQDIMREFMTNWCKNCDTKQDGQEIAYLCDKVDAISKILTEVAIKNGIKAEKIAALTQSGRHKE